MKLAFSIQDQRLSEHTPRLRARIAAKPRHAVIACLDSHRHLMITDEECLAFMDDLQQTLEKFGLPQPEQDEVKVIVESTREAIVIAPLPM
jgi:hypothetical protein